MFGGVPASKKYIPAPLKCAIINFCTLKVDSEKKKSSKRGNNKK